MNPYEPTNSLGSVDDITPMMRQYMTQKERHPDALLLFRMGDFYEMFFEDASRASRILNIALTSRDKNKAKSIPMCGFPHHSSSTYISKLLAAGERVAICDQIENPKFAKGLVKREVTRVVTPGLVDDPETLNGSENHFVFAVSEIKGEIGLASLDLSTGEFSVTSTTKSTLAGQELRRVSPKETLIQKDLSANSPVKEILSDEIYRHELESWFFDPQNCEDSLKEYFGVRSLVGFGLEDRPALISSSGALISYVVQTRSEKPSHIKAPRVYSLDTYMVLDQSSIRNLEIFKNLRDGSSNGSLISVLDRTKTHMGARLLRKWVSYPLLDVNEIKKRSELTRSFVEDPALRREIRDILTDFGDLERLAGKISLKTANPRDLLSLRVSSEKIPEIVKRLRGLETPFAYELLEMDDLSYVAHAIGSVIVDSPPSNVKDGGVIRSGYNSELDELREIGKSGKAWIAGIEKREKELTGIPNLKVGYNKVFGYFIEITRSHQDKVPAYYVRKQTLVGSERYITEELKEYELKVLNAQDRILELEEEIFLRLRDKLLGVIERIQKTAESVATIDVVSALAELAVINNYTQPEISDSDVIKIIEGRHPVVEAFVSSETYVPNDTVLDGANNQILIITGPNMAGKSTYMRQTALIVLMAQIGSFVPAKEASVGVADRIFTRIGASDYLAFGQSTFMVEMTETAEILNSATNRSLALLDEVGRGTSTFDGLAIAWAVTEFLHDMPGKGGPRTLFATHYHELVDVALIKDRVKNYNFEVREWKNKIVFLRKITPGGASRSYGLQVARLAGIPEPVIGRASEILNNLEKEEIDPGGQPKISRSKTTRSKDRFPLAQIELFPSPAEELLREIKIIDVNEMSPIQALNILWELKKKYSHV
ncbi:MAG: DNA mismatch repair protein MutS [Deltaproteobacteria bacterium]|nr:DNA mismatch repair protein MutS [Deltaproteobacteria bacterium]